MDTVTIICRQPGMRRNGVEHPATKDYPADRWNDGELKSFMADPSFEIVLSNEDGERQVIDRPTAIKQAIASLRPGDLTGAGKPKTPALEKILGFKPTAEEIDTAMPAPE